MPCQHYYQQWIYCWSEGFIPWLINLQLFASKLIKWLPGECAYWFFDNIMTWSYCLHRRYSMSQQKNSIFINEHVLNRERVPLSSPKIMAQQIWNKTFAHSYSEHTLGETRTTVHTEYNIELYKVSVTKTGTALPLPSFHSDVFHLEEQEVPFLYHLQPNSAKKKVTMRIKKKHTSKVRNYRSKYCDTNKKKSWICKVNECSISLKNNIP